MSAKRLPTSANDSRMSAKGSPTSVKVNSTVERGTARPARCGEARTRSTECGRRSTASGAGLSASKRTSIARRLNGTASKRRSTERSQVAGAPATSQDPVDSGHGLLRTRGRVRQGARRGGGRHRACGAASGASGRDARDRRTLGDQHCDVSRGHGPGDRADGLQLLASRRPGALARCRDPSRKAAYTIAAVRSCAGNARPTAG